MALTDPYAALRDDVMRRVLEGPGESDSAVRQAAADGYGAPADLQSLVEKIHHYAYRVTDEDVASLQKKYGDDQMFEIIVSASVGASRRRLLAGLRALEEA